MPEALLETRALPIGGSGRHSLGWWGVMGLVASETALFAYLLFTYFYMAINVDAAWPPSGTPDLKIASINTLILLSTSGTAWLAERCLARGRPALSAAIIVATIVLGTIFVGLQLVEWSGKGFTPVSSTYGSIFFMITGVHMVHVCVGLLILGFLLLWTLLGYFDSSRHNEFSVGAVYWHFVDAVWLFIYSSLYLSPHLGLSHGI